MLEKLKQYYKSHSVVNTIPENDSNYMWYADEHGSTIGIEKKQLTKKDIELLSLFLTPITTEELQLSSEQREWGQFLFQKEGENIPLPLQEYFKTVRFLHFSLNEAFFDKAALAEALEGLLSSQFVIIWRTNQTGVIIELYPHAKPDLELDYEVFDALTTDFFITPSVLVGTLHDIQPSMLERFRWEQKCFSLAQVHVKKQHIYRLEDVLPYVFIEKQDHSLLPLLLGDALGDKELLATVRTYLECNLNVSLAAKQQYMHRNSVQYRVDKFIEKTGIDIKSFKGAIAVYMALLLKDTSSL